MVSYKATLIIAVYKNVAALELILMSAERQTFQDFEVIVTEDNDGDEMKHFIDSFRIKSSLHLRHLSQPDHGFLKNKALNRAVAESQSDYIIFIDGDCILHKHFVAEHYKHRESMRALYGRRVLLSQSITKSLYVNKSLTRLNLLALVASGSKRTEESLYLPFVTPEIRTKSSLWGCNWSIDKATLVEINGFDEDYTLPGFGEDTDVEFRLLKRGFKLKRMKYHAIQYHLFHPLNYQDTVAMKALMQEKMNAGMTRCINGLDQYR